MLIYKLVLLLAISSFFEVAHPLHLDCNSLDLEVYETGVSEKDIKTILKAHNTLRQVIMDGKMEGQPKGIDLKYLQWDDALAKSAQEVADTCVYRHQSVRDERWRLPVGQNIGRSFKTQFTIDSANWAKIIAKWVGESSRYTYGKIGPNYQKTGHYTQVIWADSEYIGCGFNSHENAQDSEKSVEEIYVCHYGPRGNMMWKYPYRIAQKNKIRSEVPIEY